MLFVIHYTSSKETSGCCFEKWVLQLFAAVVEQMLDILGMQGLTVVCYWSIRFQLISHSLSSILVSGLRPFFTTCQWFSRRSDKVLWRTQCHGIDFANEVACVLPESACSPGDARARQAEGYSMRSQSGCGCSFGMQQTRLCVCLHDFIMSLQNGRWKPNGHAGGELNVMEVSFATSEHRAELMLLSYFEGSIWLGYLLPLPVAFAYKVRLIGGKGAFRPNQCPGDGGFG